MSNEEQKQETEVEEEQEFDARPAGNKDLWLFLIVLDVVFLCVFGFFIYKHFAARIFSPSAPQETLLAQKQEVVAEEVVAEEPAELRIEKKVVSVAVEPKEEPAVVSTVETVVADVLKTEPVAAEPVKAAPVKEEPVKSQPVVTEKKESISISGKGKYRQVTFRWFGEGEKVAVVSGFTMAKPQALNKVGDHWEKTLVIAPGAYKFLFMVDGKKTLDPYSPEQDGRSVLEIK